MPDWGHPVTTPNPYPDEDEVPDQEVVDLDQSMPTRAAQVLRKVLFRARRVWVAIDAIRGRLDAHKAQIDGVQDTNAQQTTMLQGLNDARVNHGNRIRNLEDRMAAVEARLPPPP